LEVIGWGAVWATPLLGSMVPEPNGVTVIGWFNAAAPSWFRL
jgi:hypothetical protein